MTDVSTYYNGNDLDPYFTIIDDDKAIVESCMRAFELPLRNALNDHTANLTSLEALLAYEATSDERISSCVISVSRVKKALNFRCRVVAENGADLQFSGTLDESMILKLLGQV